MLEEEKDEDVLGEVIQRWCCGTEDGGIKR